ncbi:hypothetical protein ACFSN5_04305 [Streptococcus tangpeifui]|uniref:hypothetical protein n=1 Tax=Streptococcus tangpeifui TaxID=2709400 RepID=UPI001F14F5C0|nr:MULTISPECIES: hypothetical protein [unclassified Streptococcus]
MLAMAANGLVDGLPLDTVERAVVTNAMTATLITQAFLPVSVKNQGNIFSIEVGQRLILCFTVGKNLIYGLVRGLRVDLKGTGVPITKI